MPGKKGGRSIPGARYNVKHTTKGKQVRLAWIGNEVVEAKNLKTGARHTQEEFAADRARAAARKKIKSR
jgi:hypothetical protein